MRGLIRVRPEGCVRTHPILDVTNDQKRRQEASKDKRRIPVSPRCRFPLQATRSRHEPGGSKVHERHSIELDFN